MDNLESWFWGITLIGVSIAIHAVGLVRIIIVLRGVRRYFARVDTPPRPRPWLAAALVGMVGAALAALHAIEAAIWAVAYVLLGAIESPSAAMLYSIDSMTTRGDSGLRLTDEWLILGALEAADGMLLFGISTAFLFGVISKVWSLATEDPDDKDR
jgi:hypothetical protein